VGLENDDRLTAIDTLTNTVIATVPIGQAAQAVTYVPNAVPQGNGLQGLQPLGVAGQAAHLLLAPPPEATGAAESQKAPTSVSLFDQGLLQVLQASVTGLEPMRPYVLALSHKRGGDDALEPLAAFTTNPAGSAIVNAVRPDPPSGAGGGSHRAPLSRHRAGHKRPARRSGSGPGAVIRVSPGKPAL
jgi:YVTN family beta-propeller protein